MSSILPVPFGRRNGGQGNTPQRLFSVIEARYRTSGETRFTRQGRLISRSASSADRRNSSPIDSDRDCSTHQLKQNTNSPGAVEPLNLANKISKRAG